MATVSPGEPISSPLRLGKPKKKPRRSTDWAKCIICQTLTTENLSKAGSTGREVLLSSSQVRQDELFQQLDEYVEEEPGGRIVYHRSCYQTYTSKRNLACFTDTQKQEEQKESEIKQTRQKTMRMTDWSTCFLCHSRKRGKLHHVKTEERQLTVKRAAQARTDHVMLGILEGEDLIAKNAIYHGTCMASYISVHNISAKQQQEEPPQSDGFKIAFKALITDIDQDLKNGKAFKIKSLLAKFNSLLGDDDEGNSYSTQKLQRQLKRHYGDEIVIHSQRGQSMSSIIMSSNVSLGDAVRAFAQLKTDFNSTQMETSISHDPVGSDHATVTLSDLHKVVGALREEVAGIPPTQEYPTPADVSINASSKSMPPMLKALFVWLISREAFDSVNPSLELNEGKQRKILSLIETTIHCIRRDVVMPLQLGIAAHLHHMYGRRDIIDVLSAHGFCIQYDDLRRFLTSVGEHELTKNQQAVYIPHGITSRTLGGSLIQEGDDNVDINCQTVDGKGTFHSMARVIFQEQPQHVSHREESFDKIKLGSNKSLPLSQENIMIMKNTLHYEKPRQRPERPRVANALTLIKSLRVNEDHMDAREISWILLRMSGRGMVSFLDDLHVPTKQVAPFWVGFNWMIAESKNDTKTVASYLPVIDAKPSDPKTVFTTLTRGKQLSESMGQEHSIHTMDQQLYAIAQEVKWSKPQEFPNTIIRLGGFHTVGCFIGAIGKLFSDAGLKDLLVESGVYAEATVDMMLCGKQFHRAVRGLTLTFEALMQLFIIEFAQWCNEEAYHHLPNVVWESLKETLDKLDGGTSTELTEQMKSMNNVVSQHLVTLLTEFKKWGSASSPTFQMWSTFLDTIQILLRNIRAEREGDWDLHLSSVVEMTPYLFATDRTNYSRWVPVYLLDMAELPADIKEAFQNGQFSVRRATGKFNGVWSDMGVESTVIRDSKGSGGIVGLTRKESALLRWTVTRQIMGEYAAATRSRSGNSTPENTKHEQARPAALNRDEQHVQQLFCHIQDNMTNPFKPAAHPDKQLVNIASGVIASTEIQKSMLSVHEQGTKQMEEFIQDSLSTGGSKNMFQPIKKSKIKTFALTKQKTPIQIRGKKALITVNPEMVFRRALLLTQVRPDLNLKQVLMHPITSVPTSIFHEDGALRKNNKAELGLILESQVEAGDNSIQDPVPGNIRHNVYIRDAMAELHVIGTNGGTFGNLASYYQTQLLRCFRKFGLVIDVFDQYDEINSVKTEERTRRLAAKGGARKYQVIAGRPVPQWSKFMALSENKTSLTDFLCNYVAANAPETPELSQDENRKLYLAGGFSNGTLTACISKAGMSYDPSLASTQEEADSRILFHVKHADGLFREKHIHGTITIKSADTDVLVLAVHYFPQLQNTEELWVEKKTPTGCKLIPVHQICQNLSPEVCRRLPGFHALTGCDSVSGFYGYGKKKAWKAWKALQGCGNDPPLDTLATNDIQTALTASRHLISMMYDPQEKHADYHNNLNALREKLVSSKNVPVHKLPPSEPAFHEHVQHCPSSDTAKYLGKRLKAVVGKRLIRLVNDWDRNYTFVWR